MKKLWNKYIREPLAKWWARLRAKIGSATDPAGGGADPAPIATPFDPALFCGAGDVNHWRRNVGTAVGRIARHGLQCYHIAIFGWAETQSLKDPGGTIRDLGVVIGECRRLNVRLFAEVVNDNLHLSKHGNTPIKIGDHLDAVRAVLQYLRDNYWPGLYVQPTGETQTSAGQIVEGLAAGYLPKACLVANSEGGRPARIPSWATYAAYHCAHLTDPVPKGFWDVTDHGTALGELGGTQAQDYHDAAIQADAALARANGNPYILYMFQQRSMAESDLAAVAKGYGVPAPPPVEAPEAEPDVPEDTAAIVDAVSFADLSWTAGGFNGRGAALDVPRIGSLAVSETGLSLRWLVGLRSWGLGDTDAGAIAALFCRVNGKWIGGKFEWISTSRATRSFTNIREGYNGWRPADLDAADAFAFVVVSRDGRLRSNVITCPR